MGAALIFAVLQIVERLTERFDTVSWSGSYPVIKLKGNQTLQVISVPAYDRWTPSGITLDRKTKIEIKATGLVATGFYFPEYIEKEINARNDRLDERLSRLEFNQQVYLGWRYPNGELINGQENTLAQNDNFIPATPIDCINYESYTRKIYKDYKYGTLLAFTANSKSEDSKNDSPVNVFKKKIQNKFTKIGEEADIEFKEDENSYVVKYKNGRESKETKISAKDGDSLYFTINDTIINDINDLEIFSRCHKKKYENVQKINLEDNVKNEVLYKKVYEKLDEQDYPEAMWYMDNKGEFTVTIITSE